jgi:hypothetical protein
MNDKRLNQDFSLDDNDSREISADEEKLLDDLGLFGETRRKFLGQTIAGWQKNRRSPRSTFRPTPFSRRMPGWRMPLKFQ